MIADKHTIQVKGIGRVSRTPDTIIVWMHVESCDTDYKRAVDSAAQQLNLIRANLGTIGFTKEDLKTTGFDIHARYDNIRQGGNPHIGEKFCHIIIDKQLRLGKVSGHLPCIADFDRIISALYITYEADDLY